MYNFLFQVHFQQYKVDAKALSINIIKYSLFNPNRDKNTKENLIYKKKSTDIFTFYQITQVLKLNKFNRCLTPTN